MTFAARSTLIFLCLSGLATLAVLKNIIYSLRVSCVGQPSASSDGKLVNSAIKSAFQNLDQRIMIKASKAADSNLQPGSAKK